MKFRLLNKYEINLSRVQEDLNFCGVKNGKLIIPEKCAPKKREHKGNNFYIHVHLPKTGGTTFNSVLEDNFDIKYEPFIGRLIHELPYITNEQIERYVVKHPGMKCLTSHMFRAILPYQSTNRNIIAIAVIRNPVDRFFSYYFHMRHRFGVDCEEKEMKIEEYIKFRINQVGGKPFKGYLNHFCGIENEEAFNYIKALIENKHLYIFSTYQMQEGFDYLKSEFPNDFTKTFFKQENISEKDQEVTDSMKQEIHKHVSPFDWKLLELAENLVKR